MTQSKFILLILMCLLFVLYLPGLFGPLIFDDFNNLSHTQAHFDILELLDRIFDNTSGPLKRPISIISFYFGELIFGSSSLAAKSINLFIFGVCGFLVFDIVKQLPIFEKKPQSQFALLISALFLLHPLQISTVLFTVQRMTLLSGLLTLWGMAYYLKWLNEAHGQHLIIRDHAEYQILTRPSPMKMGRGVGIISLLTLLATLSKENGVLLPFYLLVLHLSFFPNIYKNSIRFLYAYCGLCILCFTLGYPIWSLAYQRFEFNLSNRLLIENSVLLYYLKLIFLPTLKTLSLYHDDFIFSLGPYSNRLSVIFWLTLLSIAYALRQKHRMILFGLSWFWIGHLLESTVLPLELIFEHRNFLPMIGPMITATYYVFSFCQQASRKMAYVLFSGLLAALILTSYFRIQAWSSFSSLAIHHYENHPLSLRASQDYANLAIMQNQQEVALHLMSVNAARFTNKAGPLLHQWSLFCETSLPEALKTQSLSRLVYARDIFDTSQILLHLGNQHISGHCAGITQNTLQKVIETLLLNPCISSEANTMIHLNLLLARLYTFAGESKRAMQLLDKTFSETQSVLALLQKSQLLYLQNKQDEFKDSLMAIKKLNYGLRLPYLYKIKKIHALE